MSKASKDPRSHKPADPETQEQHHREDDVIVVPRGSSRARFIMTALLAVMVLTTFTVSGEVIDVLTGRSSAKSAFMSWKRPDGSVERIKSNDFLIVKQNLSKTQALLSGGRSSRDLDDAQTARQILVDRLAQDAGVYVTDAELSKIILSVFGSADAYKSRLASYRTSAKEFEDTLRSMLRVRRYQMLLAAAYSTPDPKEVEKQWIGSHQEYLLETVEIPTDRFADEATGACPAGDELKAWFEALPEAEKSTYRTQVEAKTAAEFAWFSIDPLTNSQRLFAKYPRPEGENADEVAKTWYEANKDQLFRKPDLPKGKAPSPADILPFEEVKERAQAEAAAFESLNDWLNDIKLREEKGETITLIEEGQAIGLGYRRESNAHTRAEWASLGMFWHGHGPIDSMLDPAHPVGKLLPDVLIDPKALLVGRLLERQESRLPAFDEIQDKVREGWIKKKEGELALAKLEALRAKFSTAPEPVGDAGPQPQADTAVETDAAKFQAAAAELGLEVKTQDWLDAGARVKPGSATPMSAFLRRVASREGSTPGAISKPELAPDRSAAWLAHVAGKRDPDPARMTPLDYQVASQMASYEARDAFLQNSFQSDAFLKEHFGLDLETWRREGAEKGAEKK